MLRFLLFAVALFAACDQSSSPRARADQVAGGASFKRPRAERIVAIGDLHGDLAATRAALRLAGALGAGDHWAGWSKC